MSDKCSHDCSSCSEKCSSRTIQKEKLNEGSKVKKVIGVVSGKGGVGKSLITSLLAVCSSRKGLKTAILDADVTGPSIPRIFGVNDKAMSPDGKLIIPCESMGGIKVMSVNLMLDDETQPVVWRGPVIAGVVKQFWTDVDWGEVDYMFVDMPPGTGDVPLTVFQSLPIDGIVVVTTPQDLVSMIVTKAVNMAKMMNVPLLAIVENMSYLNCPDCNKKIKIFGNGSKERLIEQGYENVVEMPIRPEVASLCDVGQIEQVDEEVIKDLYQVLFND